MMTQFLNKLGFVNLDLKTKQKLRKNIFKYLYLEGYEITIENNLVTYKKGKKIFRIRVKEENELNENLFYAAYLINKYIKEEVLKWDVLE